MLHNASTTAGLYAGEITPAQAFEQLKSNKSALLVDVRTLPEWSFTGYPDLASLQKEVIRLSWRFYPTMQQNTEFVAKLAQYVPNKNTPLLFICRTGGRSLDAAIAMTEAGYTACYNVSEGFEGEKDSNNHRGITSGWKAAHLPWRQD